MRQQGTATKNCPKLIHPVTCQYATTTDSKAVTNQRAENKGNSWASTRPDCCMRSPTRLSTESRALLTNQFRTWYMLFSQRCNVVLPLLHTVRTFAEQLVTRLQRAGHCTVLLSDDKLHPPVNGKRVRERDGVRCSVLLGSDLPHSGPPILRDPTLQASPPSGPFGLRLPTLRAPRAPPYYLAHTHI